ncbi:alpha/beta hydrolase [Sporolactobacillus shoreicorticis]|uniref:Alpha/beta fold hydrolase n=1 Tax=Sporolactobacillus shoreicorticis TaxID=1923877 RepID=A0ABW5S766_9BACL|nr:alpha/beta hydrolase [Sporolactobacillus shoreicorticis]MCO7124426.1 alpha/beta hydrolase [Sporolactobacillus shoreicorticis]
MKSFFVSNGSVKIHVLENGVPSHDTPSLLVIGGIWEPAERAIPILSQVGSHTVALSFRGRGLSSTPAKGYDLDDHLSDVQAVVKHLQLDHYCVLGFSRGVSYALGWSLKNQQSMSGLILVDQPPLHSKPDSESVAFWANLEYLGVPILNFMRKTALEGLEREATQIDFSSQLSQLRIPVTFFVGKNKNSKIRSDISEEILQLYRQKISCFNLVTFQKSGHMIPDEEQQKYIAEIASFIKKRSES